MTNQYSTQKVLELACAAYRMYGSYLKEPEYKYDENNKFLYVKHSNKDLVKYSLGVYKLDHTEQEFRPADLILDPVDTLEAEEIRKYFRRLMFSAVKGTNDFETEINTLLNQETIEKNKIGYIACLPQVYRRDKIKNDISKQLKNCEDKKLAELQSTIYDKDCEILKVERSKNFDAWNVLAIIDNAIVSWLSNKEIKTGPAIVLKAKVKGYSDNYQTKKFETRLNYVKVAQ